MILATYAGELKKKSVRVKKVARYSEFPGVLLATVPPYY